MSESFLIVVCIGDSMTAGYRARDPYALDRRVPYPAQLEKLIRRWFYSKNSSFQAYVINAGINGDSTDGMIQRFDSDVAHEKPEVVVIWGGLNDLAAGQTPQGVVENLIRLSGRCSEIGCFPILCSLTHGIEPSLINRRINETNELLRRHCDSNNVTFADLTSVLSDNDGRLRLEYSDDGVHLNEWGYSEVAKVIFSGIVPFLEERLRD